jgi:VWFA-related protein
MREHRIVSGNLVRRWIAAFFCCCTLLWTQDAPTFSTDVKVVNVLATVRDKKGRIIRDLSQEDFAITENGRPQNIRYFARQTDLPLTLGLMVDTSMSQRRVLDAERGASFRFFDQVLRSDKDRIFIMQFDMSVQLRQELTSSRLKLDDALVYVDTPTNRELQIPSSAGTLLYDAVVKASKDIMKNQRGRKALIVLSDGVDIGSESTIAEAIDAAVKSDTIIYSILFSDPGAYSIPLLGRGVLGPDGKGHLMHLAQETGGGFFEVSKKQNIEQVYEILQDELRSQYSLGYVSDEPVRISEFRKLQLTVKTKGLVVQARNRYWAQR